jgi:cytochrome c peroxidase
MGSISSSCCTPNDPSLSLIYKHVCPPPTDMGENPFYPVAQSIYEIINDPTHDDGSLAPLFIRLAWHSCGTFDNETKSGGCNGATMRFEPESEDPENVGLKKAIDILTEKVQKKHHWISHSDVWILASYVAFAVTGGPLIRFKGGRTDCPLDKIHKRVPENGRLPNAEFGIQEGLDEQGRINGFENLAQHIRTVFHRIGFMEDCDIVALIAGGHAYGRCHRQLSGYQGPWVATPTQFSNEFAADLIDDEWVHVGSEDEQAPFVVRPCCNKRQFVGKAFLSPSTTSTSTASPQMMLPSDMTLLWDESFKSHLQVYAQDENKLKQDFSKCWERLTSLGCNLSDKNELATMYIVSIDTPYRKATKIDDD